MELLSKIREILVNDVDIESKFVKFYRNLFTKKVGQRCLPDIDDWGPILDLRRESLKAPFTEEGIHRAVIDLGSNKSHGPDEFTAEFFKKPWNILKEDIKGMLNDFFRSATINANLPYSQKGGG